MRRSQRLLHQGLRLVFDLTGSAAFLAGALIAYALMRPPHPAAPAILFLALNAAVTVLVVERAATFLCDPRQPNLRLIPIAMATAYLCCAASGWSSPTQRSASSRKPAPRL